MVIAVFCAHGARGRKNVGRTDYEKTDTTYGKIYGKSFEIRIVFSARRGYAVFGKTDGDPL